MFRNDVTHAEKNNNNAEFVKSACRPNVSKFIHSNADFLLLVSSREYNQPQHHHQQQNPLIVRIQYPMIPDTVQMMMEVNQNYLNSNKQHKSRFE